VLSSWVKLHACGPLNPVGPALLPPGALALVGTMSCQIVSVPRPVDAVTAIKPYCGARPVLSIVAMQPGGDGAVSGGDRAFKAPSPAWADLGVVGRLQAAVVPEPLPEKLPPHLKPQRQTTRCLYAFSVVILSILENVLCYLAYFEIRSPEDKFYNKFEAHMLGLPGLDTALQWLAVFNTGFLFLFWSLVAIVRLDLYRPLAGARLALSLPCGAICMAAVFFGEGTKVFPFLCATAVLLHLVVCVAYELWLKRKNLAPWQQKACFVGLVFICSWISAWAMMFVIDHADYLRDKDCPATTNKAMPVRIHGVQEWLCVRWGEPHYIERTALESSGSPYDALCSTSFHAFDVVASNGTSKVSSLDAHLVRCPAHCQELGLGTLVIGCQVYSAESSICSAAVQMGILKPDLGGIVKVVGRSPSESMSGLHSRCDRNGILSTDRSSPSAASVRNGAPRWAFYFQVAGMEDLDFVMLHGWRRIGTPGAQEPWRSYSTSVTWVVGGTKHQREVVLGPGAGADIELNFCRADGTSGRTCE